MQPMIDPVPQTVPQVITAYIQAVNDQDTDAMLASFDETAIVRDDEETLQGKDAIKAWIDKVTEDYQVTHVVTSVVAQTDEFVVSLLTAGNFEGSPFPFRYHFHIAGDKITTLEIEFAG